MPAVTPTQSASNTLKQLSDGNDQGTSLGIAGNTAQGVPDKIGFFGAVAAQASGNAQAAITRGQACGMVISFTSKQSPSSVPGSETAEVLLTLMAPTAGQPLAATDLVYINKPTAQAGLGMGNARGAGVGLLGVTFSNLTAATILPTVTEQYQAIAIRGFNTLTAALTPAAVGPASTVEQLFTITGLRTGELVQVNKPTQQAGLDIVGCRVAANNQLGITFMNCSVATIIPTAAESYTIACLGGLDAVNNDVLFQITASPTSLQVGSMTEYAMPVTGLLLGDVVKGVSKPSFQSGLGIVGMRVSVPSTIGVTFYNAQGFATLQPTAGEVYDIAITRANPVAPMLLYSQALTPTAVPGSTTAEQTFTVTGLIASTPVWVNKPSAQNGLGIAGVRVSAANTLAINFSNTNTNSITPTAGETYIIGNWQDPAETGGVNGTGTGNALSKSAVGVVQQNAILSNKLRGDLVAYGLEAGA